MATTKTALKQYFKKYATPTEAQFAELIDAFVHKDEDSITQDKIDGLTAALNSKVSTQDLSTAVAAAVAETLQDGNIEVTPAAHEHAISDVSGLGDRLTTLETSKADYEAFKTLVTAFLNDADVSDTTINRWKELEDFLDGVTDSDTLAGMLQALKAEILGEIPQGNYLEQVTDMAAKLQTAETGKIVQYVGQSTAEYQRGLCYEKVERETTSTQVSLTNLQKADNLPSEYLTLLYTEETVTLPLFSPSMYIIKSGDTISPGDIIWWSASGLCEEIQSVTATEIIGTQHSIPLSDYLSDYSFFIYKTSNGGIVYCNNRPTSVSIPGCNFYTPTLNMGFLATLSAGNTIVVETSTWQPLVTSPAVS